MGGYEAAKDAVLDPSLRLVEHMLGLGARTGTGGEKRRGLMQRQIRAGSAAEGGSRSGAAAAKRQVGHGRVARRPEQ